jgi:small GTP-binding protein
MIRNDIKIAVIGTTNVGKSCICATIAGRLIDREYIPTIGVDYFTKIYNDTTKLCLWDLTGLQRFERVIYSYVRDSPVLLYCYSSESYESFRHMLYKYYDHYNRGYTIDKRIIIVVTKTDSKNSINNFNLWGEEFTNKYKYPFIQTSSYTKEGIQDLINTFVSSSSSSSLSSSTKIQSTIQEKISRCCLF